MTNFSRSCSAGRIQTVLVIERQWDSSYDYEHD